METVICKDTQEICYTYSSYLKSKHWFLLKERYKKSKLYTGVCEVCLEKKSFMSFHHKTYKRIGQERLMDIIYVCQDCHEKVHVIHKNNKENGRNRGLWCITTKMIRNRRKKSPEAKQKKLEKIEQRKIKKEKIKLKNKLRKERKIEKLNKDS